jgi:peptidoglycan biosynthesis protein MviN/MurJ (putative lipid II flippase)
MSKIRVRPFRDFLLSLVGPVVWAAHFFVIYGAEALVCTGAEQAAIQNRGFLSVAALATAIALAALGGFALWQLRAGRRGYHEGSDETAFLRITSLALAVLSMMAVIWVALPVTMIGACAPPAG